MANAWILLELEFYRGWEAITHKLMAKKILNTYKKFLTTLHFIVHKSEFIIFISWWEEIK